MRARLALAAVSAALLSFGCDSAKDTPAVTYNRVFLTGFTINNTPFTNQSGGAWDIGSAPDIYFVLTDKATGAEVLTGQQFQDIGPSALPLRWTLNNYEVPIDKAYILRVYDADVGGGRELMWTQDNITMRPLANAGYTTTLPMRDAAGTIDASLTVMWSK